MAELTPKTISELPTASALSDGDMIPISSSGTSKKTLWSTIKSALRLGTEAQNLAVGTTSVADRWANVICTVDNENNSLNGHRLNLYMKNDGLFLYDTTAASTLYNVSFPLAVGNGGTGATTTNGIWNNLGGGGGAGYCKLPDGTMIQWGVVTGLSFSNEAKLEGTQSFSQTFYSSPTIIAGGISTGVSEYAFRIGAYASSGSSFSWSMHSGTGAAITVSNRGFQWLAIGRWKA